VAHEILSDPQQRATYDFQKLAMESLTAVPRQTFGSVQHRARSGQKMPHLLDELRKFQLPSHRHTLAIKSGYAGDYRRWVCIMCPNAKHRVTTKESAGMELHLKSHGYLPEHIARVFGVTNGEALYRYFGPYTETEAHKNEIKVEPWNTFDSHAATESLQVQNRAYQATSPHTSTGELTSKFFQTTGPKTAETTMIGDSTAPLPPKTDNSSLVRIGKLDHQNKEVHSPTQKSKSPITRRRNPSATDLAPVAPDNCHSHPHNGDSITGQLNDKKQLFSARFWRHYQSLTELDRISRPSTPHAETPLMNMQPTTAAITPPKMSSETQATSCAGANESEGPTIESNTFLESLGRLTLKEQDSVGGVGGACSSQTEQRDPPNSVDTPSSTGKPDQTNRGSPDPGTSSSKLAGEISCNSGSTNTDSSSSGAGRSGSSHAGAPRAVEATPRRENALTARKRTTTRTDLTVATETSIRISVLMIIPGPLPALIGLGVRRSITPVPQRHYATSQA